MKILLSILAFIVLVLSCLPCADESNNVSIGKNQASVGTDNSTEDPGEEDNCSPFCHCTCCSGFSFDQYQCPETVVLISENKTYNTFLHKDLIEISLPVWQPPQLLNSIS